MGRYFERPFESGALPTGCGGPTTWGAGGDASPLPVDHGGPGSNWQRGSTRFNFVLCILHINIEELWHILSSARLRHS